MKLEYKLAVLAASNGLEILVLEENLDANYSSVMDCIVIKNADAVNHYSKFISTTYNITNYEWFGVDATPEKPVKNQRRKIKKFLLEALTILG